MSPYIFSGVSLKQTLKRKFEEAGVPIADSDHVVDRLATDVLGSRADNTVNKYSQQVRVFKDFCAG